MSTAYPEEQVIFYEHNADYPIRYCGFKFNDSCCGFPMGKIKPISGEMGCRVEPRELSIVFNMFYNNLKDFICGRLSKALRSRFCDALFF
jgi:hypothetical protein